MKTLSTKKQNGKPGMPGFSGMRAFTLLGMLFMALAAKAQMSGTYTIGAGGNYTGIGAAIKDLISNGVSAPVLFNVNAATFTESVTITDIPGASAKNTITFRGAGRSKTIFTSSGQTLYLNQCKYVTFDQMTISTTATSGYLINTYYDVSCGITNSNIVAPAYPSATVYEIYSNYATNFSLINNSVIGGYISYYNYGIGGSATVGFNTCKNNRFVHNGYYHIYAYYGTGNTYTGNVFDSSAYGYGYSVYSIYETGCTYSSNQFINPGVYVGGLWEYNNAYSVSIAGSVLPFVISNNVFSNASNYPVELIPLYAAAPTIFAHNTISCPSNGIYAMLYEPEYCSVANTQIFASNIITSANTSNPALYVYMYSSGTLPGIFKQWDGNCIYNSGGPLCYFYNGSSGTLYADINTYKKALAPFGFEAYASNVAPPFVKAPNDLHILQTVTAPSGVYAGVDVDMDGDTRCKLFPTAGADESGYAKGVPTVIFYLPVNIYPNSPTYIYQFAKEGEPKKHSWILNGVTISNSTVLFTNQFTVGSNTLELITQSCGGSASYKKIFNVAAPTAVPGSDFIADKNIIKAGEMVSFKDLSSNGPTKWLWDITPATIVVSGTTVPSFKIMNGSATDQNPQVQFTYGGKYSVCMTATNGVGKGANVCKKNYINVVPTVNLASGTKTVHDANGYLYDNGGPNGNYTYDGANGYVESIIIDPCADSVYLSFSKFDTYCGYDYVRLYEGRDNTGKPLWSSKCSGTGTSGFGPGYVGGKAVTCGSACMPNVAKPDTFKAKSAIYLQMVCYAATNSAGFEAYWWSKPKTSAKPKASFTNTGGGVVCTNGMMSYTNTTKIDPNDPATFLWDLNGDFSDGFECVGACATTSYPYFLAGPVDITLIATNCGGTDTAKATISVFFPNAPKVKGNFKADNTTPTTNDIVFFTTSIPQCVDDYRWTIKKTKNNNGWKPQYVNGTSFASQNPQVVFSDIGLYTVKLFVDNASGAQKDSDSIVSYINVRNPYCIPSVAVLNTGLGISRVVFNTIDNKTSPAAQEYTNNAANPALGTSIAVGASYKISISRDAAQIFDPINRTVFIDWDGDGSFSGAGEIAASDSDSYTADFTANITVPATAKKGATIMRIAVNYGLYPNAACGLNQLGEYQDYRIYITPYNILPVITLKGYQGYKDTIYLEQGYPFIEPGDSASSYLYGTITGSMVISTKPAFSIYKTGNYEMDYDVTDKSGNKAITQRRIIKITPDKTSPNLIVEGPDTTIIDVTKAPQTPRVPKPISADDLVDGPMIGYVNSDSGHVQTNIIGTYIVTYQVSDFSGNPAVVYRVVIVVDRQKPVISLLGNAVETLQAGSPYNDPGVFVSDNYYNASVLNPLLVVTSALNAAKTGQYIMSYNLTDPSGNKADEVTRMINVVDTIKPVISLKGLSLDSTPVFKPYNDPGVNVADNYDGPADVKLEISGTFYSRFPGGINPDKTGTYTIKYTATDKSGNTASVLRVVKVQDRDAPVITLAGEPVVNVCRWFHYTDAGYTVSDNYDQVSELRIDTLGTYKTNGGTTMHGLVTLIYTATDRAGNRGVSVARIVNVKPAEDFTCVTGIDPGKDLDNSISIFPNPGAGIFTINMNIADNAAGKKMRITVTSLLGQEISVIHDGQLQSKSMKVDLSSQAAGVYLLNFVTENQTLTKRIVIAK